MKFISFFLCLWFIFALLVPVPNCISGYGFRNPIESGSNLDTYPDPDPQHWLLAFQYNEPNAEPDKNNLKTVIRCTWFCCSLYEPSYCILLIQTATVACEFCNLPENTSPLSPLARSVLCYFFIDPLPPHYRARICKPFKEPRNRFPGCRNHSSESITVLLKRLQIRALDSRM